MSLQFRPTVFHGWVLYNHLNKYRTMYMILITTKTICSLVSSWNPTFRNDTLSRGSAALATVSYSRFWRSLVKSWWNCVVNEVGLVLLPMRITVGTSTRQINFISNWRGTSSCAAIWSPFWWFKLVSQWGSQPRQHLMCFHLCSDAIRALISAKEIFLES